MFLCNLGPCRNVGHIQLWIADGLCKQSACPIGNRILNSLHICRIHKDCPDAKRFQIMEQINGSTVKTCACDDLISAANNIEQCIRDGCHTGSTCHRSCSFFQNGHALLERRDRRVTNSRIRISSSFIMKQLLVLLRRRLKKSTGLVHRCQCCSGDRIACFRTM